MIKVVYDHDSKMTWAVRLVVQGDAYGRSDACVHRDATPLVEFFDTRFEFSDLGQFVSRYYADALVSAPDGGFCLDDGIPDWNLSAGALRRVQKWVAAKLQQLSKEPVTADETLEV